MNYGNIEKTKTMNSTTKIWFIQKDEENKYSYSFSLKVIPK